MPSSDYTSTGGGLKLKGAKNAGVDKKRKKKSNKEQDKLAPQDTPGNTSARTTSDVAESGTKVSQALEDEESRDKQEMDPREVRDFGKTEAERRHEERRRKRLDERLKREGVKTHKERVEALNKYLSTLSEHHDMPRIGPG
ncbi:hypothetical protein MBLNU459_g2768t1 [Dothideomycetes sp. NU459]